MKLENPPLYRGERNSTPFRRGTCRLSGGTQRRPVKPVIGRASLEVGRQAIQVLVCSSPNGKPLIWLGRFRADLRRFPAQARRLAGYQLWRVQLGIDPTDSKLIPTVGPGFREI